MRLLLLSLDLLEPLQPLPLPMTLLTMTIALARLTSALLAATMARVWLTI